jgi:transposase
MEEHLMNLGIVSQADIDRLTQMLKHEKFSRIHDRIRVALWGLNGLTAKTIADRLDRKIRWAQTWAARFRDEGVNGLFGHPKPGFTQKLPHDCEEIFVARVLAGPLKDDEVSIFHGKEIQQILRNEFHCNYSLAGVYLLLHRLRLSWIVPRPVHEKNDPEAMKVWLEENSRILAEEKKNIRGNS